MYDIELGHAENWAALQSEKFLQLLSKNLRNKQENIFELLKIELFAAPLILPMKELELKFENKYMIMLS